MLSIDPPISLAAELYTEESPNNIEFLGSMSVSILGSIKKSLNFKCTETINL